MPSPGNVYMKKGKCSKEASYFDSNFIFFFNSKFWADPGVGQINTESRGILVSETPLDLKLVHGTD